MILVVDDTSANIDIMVEILGDIDDVAVAISGEDALEIMREEHPSVVLLDIMMPGMDGFEVFSIMRGDEMLRDIPVIFLSGNDSSREKAKGLRMGAADYLTKPVDPELIISRVKTYL